jgi:hypothetical protein
MYVSIHQRVSRDAPVEWVTVRLADRRQIQQGQEWLHQREAAQTNFAEAKARHERNEQQQADIAARQQASAQARLDQERRANDERVRNGGSVAGHFLPEEAGVSDGLTKWAQRFAAAGVPAAEAFLRAEEELARQPGWKAQRREAYWRHFHGQQAQEAGRRRDLESLRQAQARHLERRGFSGVAGEMKALLSDSAARRAQMVQAYANPASDEAQAALKAHDDEIAAKHQALRARADEQAQKMAALYEGWARHQDVPAWNQPGTAHAEIRHAAEQAGMPEEDVRYWLEYYRRADWRRPLTKAPQGIDAIKQAAGETMLELAGEDTLQDKVRLLPDGAITINPELHGDKEAFANAVRQSGASPAVQEEALARFPELQRQWARSIMPALMDQADIPFIGGRTFQQWWMDKAEDVRAGKEDAAFLAKPDEEKVLQYVDEMKRRHPALKYGDTILRSLIKGGGAVVSGALGLGGLILGKDSDAGRVLSQAAADFSAENDRLTAGMEHLGQDGLGHKVVGTLSSLLPQIGTMIMTGGITGGSRAAIALLAGGQGAGSQYAETYGKLIKQPGMTHEKAWAQVAPWAVGSGIVTGILSAVGGKSGVEALARNPQALRHTLGSAWKSFFKGAVKENLEEIPDELFSQVSAALAVDRDADISRVIGNFIRNSPELMISVALLGGGGEAKQTFSENQQMKSQAAEAAPVIGRREMPGPNDTQKSEPPAPAPAPATVPEIGEAAPALADRIPAAISAGAAPPAALPAITAPPAAAAPMPIAATEAPNKTLTAAAQAAPPRTAPEAAAPASEAATPATAAAASAPSKAPVSAQDPARTRGAQELLDAYVKSVGHANHPTARKLQAGQRALEVMPPDQRAIFQKALDLDADRHAAGIPSALEYHRLLGGGIDPAVAAVHRWLDSFRPEDARTQWNRLMGASGRGAEVAAVLQSALGLGRQSAANTAIEGTDMPVYASSRRPSNEAEQRRQRVRERIEFMRTGRRGGDANGNGARANASPQAASATIAHPNAAPITAAASPSGSVKVSQSGGATSAAQTSALARNDTSATSSGPRPTRFPSAMQVAATRPLSELPSLFGRLEGRRAWALEKVRELVAISNDPNRPAKDRESARRGAGRITLDLARSAGLTLMPEEVDGATNPLLARIDGWSSRESAHLVNDGAAPRAPGSNTPKIPALGQIPSVVERTSYHQKKKEATARSSYARAMENRRLRENRPARTSPPSDQMQVLIFDEHGEALRKATLLADYAHDDGDLSQVTLNHRVDTIDADGAYRASDGAIGARIGVRRECTFPLLTTLHEIGHHIRKHLGASEVSTVAEAARNTESGRICQSLGVNLDYWLSDSELFSRFYAQWVIEKVANQEGLQELQSVFSGPDYWQQFSGQDRMHVFKLLEDLLKKKGWL